MGKKILAGLLAALLLLSLAACGEKEGEETTLSGMVVAVDGTVISLMEMDADGERGGASKGQRPSGEAGEGSFGGFGGFGGAYDGTFPQGEDMPQWGDGERPQWGEGEMPQMPDGITMPEGMTLPEGMTMPEREMPDFEGGNGGMLPGSEGFGGDVETKEMDIGKAHISVQIDGGKASGTMDDITVGTMVTLTINGKGEVTNVLVTSQNNFGGGGRMPWGNQGKTE